MFSQVTTLVNILMGGYYSIVCLDFLTLTQIWFTIWIYFLKSLFMNICKTLNTNYQTTFREFIATYSPIKGLFIVHITAPLPLLKTKNFISSLFLFFKFTFFLLLSEIGHFSRTYETLLFFFFPEFPNMSFACISVGIFIFFLFTCMNLFHIKDVNILSLY